MPGAQRKEKNCVCIGKKWISVAAQDAGGIILQMQITEKKNSLSLLFRPIKKRRESMSVGMILLAVWLILQGLPLIVRFVIPNKVMGILALLAGILILIGR